MPLGLYDPHRISRRHLGLGGFLPRIEGPVLEAVERKARRMITNFQNVIHHSFASASRPLQRKEKKRRRGVRACAYACVCVSNVGVKNHDVLLQDDVERGGQQCA